MHTEHFKEPAPSPKITLLAAACAEGKIKPLAPEKLPLPLEAHTATSTLPPLLKAGTVLENNSGQPLFTVTGRVILPVADCARSRSFPLLKACQNFDGGQSLDCRARIKGRSLAFITLSDKGALGLREDKSGPAIAEIIGAALPLSYSQGFILPDEPAPLRCLVTELALGHGYDIICTTGGTGLGPRDITPETLAPLLDLRLPGFEQAMMAASLAKTPNAAISRAIAGAINKTLLVSLPGSLKAVRENLAAIAPALAHALDKLNNDPTDCGG